MTTDGTSSLSAILLDLPGFQVLAAAEYGGELEVLVETTQTRVMCGQCGRTAAAHGRREQLVRDLEMAGRPVVLVWHKRIWRCRSIDCPTVTWTETSDRIAPRAALTERYGPG